MRTSIHTLVTVFFALVLISCSNEKSDEGAAGSDLEQTLGGGQASVVDDESQKNILHIALGSKDHTTLVAAVQAAQLENALSNAGPFTVFAPTDAAFGKLPAGTVDDLVKPENKDKLSDILFHHLAISVFDESNLQDGQDLGMFDGKTAKITKTDGGWFIDGHKVLGTVKASNGVVHVVDGVVLGK